MVISHHYTWLKLPLTQATVNSCVGGFRSARARVPAGCPCSLTNRGTNSNGDGKKMIPCEIIFMWPSLTAKPKIMVWEEGIICLSQKHWCLKVSWWSGCFATCQEGWATQLILGTPAEVTGSNKRSPPGGNCHGHIIQWRKIRAAYCVLKKSTKHHKYWRKEKHCSTINY